MGVLFNQLVLYLTVRMERMKYFADKLNDMPEKVLTKKGDSQINGCGMWEYLSNNIPIN